MTIQHINTGSSPNKGDGDSLRTAFNKINANFDYLSTATGSGSSNSLGDLRVVGSTVSTAGTNEPIIFNPNGTGTVRLIDAALEFTNLAKQKPGISHILYTTGSGQLVGLGLDDQNASLRIVGDGVKLGTLVDMGIYVGNTWTSKVYIDSTGTITAAGGFRFGDGSVQSSAVALATTSTAGSVFLGDGVTSATIGIATTATLGLVKVGRNLAISPDGTLRSFGSGGTGTTITVSYWTSGTYHGEILGIDTIRFDTEAGFTVDDLGDGSALIGMNSTFKYWHVDGQPTLIADGLDHIQIRAGYGIEITTDPLATIKEITFSVTTNTFLTTTSYATSTTAGAIKPGGGLLVAADGTLTLGDVRFDSTVIYPKNHDLGIILANGNLNSEGSSGTTFISIPGYNNALNDLLISTPNQLTITTDRASTNGISIAPNVDGYGPGYVAVGSNGTSTSAGSFFYSATAEIDMWPSNAMATLAGASGVLDLKTYNNGNIGIRPNGTGTVIVTSGITVSGTVVQGTSYPDQGGDGSDSSNYKTNSVLLDLTKATQKLVSGDYYLPPGREGQIMYFAPSNGAGSGPLTRVWTQGIRTWNGGLNAVVAHDRGWLVFGDANTVVNFAIYTDGAWNPSTGSLV